MDDDPEATAIAAQILFLIFLTLVNAFFAGAEMAVVSVNKNKIKKLADEGNKKAALIHKLSEDSTSFLSTIQVAITFAGFFSSASAATGISQILADKLHTFHIPYSQSIAVIVVTIILSYFTLVFGELVPKRIALQKAEGFSLFCVKPIYFISKVMAPFIKLLSLSTNGFLRLIGMKNAGLEDEISEEEIKAMLQTGSETGVFDETEKEMITSIFSFDDKKAKEVMTPRQEIVAIDLNEPSEEYLDEILQSMHSKIPVYEDEIDCIVGILSIKDYIIRAKQKSFEQVDIRECMQKPYLVPEGMKINKLFREMQKNKLKMAILIDEYGGVSGIVTTEDLIEEIVGDLYDEYEEIECNILQIDDNHYQVSGSILLYELNDELKLNIQSDCDTLSGYLIERLGYIPEEKDLPLTVCTSNIHYTVLSVIDRVINQVSVEMSAESADS